MMIFHEIAGQSNFCMPYIDGWAPEVMTCMYTGRELPRGDPRFCPWCGGLVLTETAVHVNGIKKGAVPAVGYHAPVHIPHPSGENGATERDKPSGPEYTLVFYPLFLILEKKEGVFYVLAVRDPTSPLISKDHFTLIPKTEEAGLTSREEALEYVRDRLNTQLLPIARRVEENSRD
jgi:hypothetical protein